MSRARGFVSLTIGLLALVALPLAAHADEPVTFGPNDVHSVFHVAKSENQNQVHYALRLDAACRPTGKQPVFAYWSRYRETGRVAAPLEGLGTRFYGASDQQKVEAGQSGGHVQMYVKALERVLIDIAITRGEHGCVAVPTTLINGERANLSSAYLQLGHFGLSVKHVDLKGTRTRDGSPTTERMKR